MRTNTNRVDLEILTVLVFSMYCTKGIKHVVGTGDVILTRLMTAAYLYKHSILTFNSVVSVVEATGPLRFFLEKISKSWCTDMFYI